VGAQPLPHDSDAMVDQLRDRRRLGRDNEGPMRLMRKLIRRGLPEEHLIRAAALVLELDRQAGVEEEAR
jgi:hypothetical protein